MSWDREDYILLKNISERLENIDPNINPHNQRLLDVSTRIFCALITQSTTHLAPGSMKVSVQWAKILIDEVADELPEQRGT